MKNIIICGLDEAGRGSLAGPIVGAGVILSQNNLNLMYRNGIKLIDGKLMTNNTRRLILDSVINLGIPYQTTIIGVKKINRENIGKVNIEIFRKLISRIEANKYIVDGNLKVGKIKNKRDIACIPDADATIFPVILAGIIAKVIRDNLMLKLAKKFPYYGWDHNFGYGTQSHINSIIKYGTCQEHRTKFVITAINHYQNRKVTEIAELAKFML